ncbi:MAG: 2-oxoacid:acceptor oxidoreductase family protein, partial [Deltaproteobacteria bacterium]|nr:2-oxoacid:acceptor oxidoreductase family protein [Deltaproteobacteria bacterium]
NLPSLDKFEPAVRPGGCIVVNTSLINRDVARTDVKVIKVATNEVALALGNARAANIVALGAFVGATDVVSMEQVEALVRETFAAKPKAIELNIAAVRKGYSIGRGE